MDQALKDLVQISQTVDGRLWEMAHDLLDIYRSAMQVNEQFSTVLSKLAATQVVLALLLEHANIDSQALVGELQQLAARKEFPSEIARELEPFVRSLEGRPDVSALPSKAKASP